MTEFSKISSTTYGASRLYPKAVQVGDVLVFRKASHGGIYTDATTVARGSLGRIYVTVTSITLTDGWYRIETDWDQLPFIGQSPNAKLLVRKIKPVTQEVSK